MARGGSRIGAGRPKNKPNKATIARQERIASTGVTPLDVMIADMRFHFDRYQQALRDKDDAKASAELAAARDAAKDAAPYTHPRLASVEHAGRIDSNVTISDGRSRLAHLIDSVAATEEPAGDPRTTH